MVGGLGEGITMSGSEGKFFGTGKADPLWYEY